MDKQMIEEMAKDMVDYGMDGYPTFDSVFMETKLREQIFHVFLGYAERLIKKGYRKIPEGGCVLSKEEYDGKEIVVEMSGGHKLRLSVGKFCEMSKILEEQTRKETAEKFAEKVKEIAKDKLELYGWQMVDIDDIDEICKELTEGKNEQSND